MLSHAHYCNVNVIFYFVPFSALDEQNRTFFFVPEQTHRCLFPDAHLPEWGLTSLLFHADDLIIPTRCWKTLQFTCHELCLRVCLTDICSSPLLTASTSMWHRAALTDNWQDTENNICITFKPLKSIPTIKITDAVSSTIYDQAI